ncbi:MAG: tetratricopeptide repeat protein [Pyrinomonadaceae bacterium]
MDYTNAIAASPNSVRGYVGLAHVFESKGEINSAIAELQTFLRNFEASGKTPKDKSVKVPVGELKTYERPGKEPDGSQDVVGRLGTVVIAGNTLEEIEKSKNAMERSANIRSAYYFLASLFQKIGDLDQAILSLDKGIALKSDEGQGHGLRANARIAKGDLNGAIEDLEAALKDPMPWQDKNKNRGLLYTLQGRDEDAAKEFAQFLQRFPKAKDELDKEIAQAHALYTRNATK